MADVNSLKIEINANQVTATIDGIKTRLDSLGISINRAETNLGRVGRGFGGAMGNLARGASAAGAAAGAAGGAFLAFGGVMNTLVGTAGRLAATLGAVVTTLGLVQIVRVNAEYQRLQASLVTVTGSAEEANRVFVALQEFARTTPFQLTEVTQAFIRMRALGIETSTEALTAFGNAASAFGTPLIQFVEAVADASVGEFERLREFGIRAERVGERVAFTFRGQTTIIRNDSLEIQRFLRQLAETNFGGGMARQAGTIGGVLSNLRDTAEQLASSFGEGGFNAAFIDFIRTLDSGLGSLDGFASRLGAVAGEALRGFTAALQSTGTALSEFMGQMVSFGGATQTLGDTLAQIGRIGIAAFRTLVTGTIELIGPWISGIGQLLGDLAGLFDSTFGRSFVVLIAESVATAAEVLFTFFRDLPAVVVASFRSAGAVITEFVRSLGGLLSGNLSAFSGFGERVDRGLTESLSRAYNNQREILERFFADIENSARAVQTGENAFGAGRLARLLAESRRQVEENSQRVQEAARQAEEAQRRARQGDDPLRSTPPRDIFQQNGTSLTEFTRNLDQLVDRYAPAIQRQRDLAQAMQTLGLATRLTREQLAEFGLTQEQVQRIIENVNRSLGEQASFFNQTRQRLQAEFTSMTDRSNEDPEVRRRGRVNERLSQIIEQANRSNEPLSNAQQEELRSALAALDRGRSLIDSMAELRRFRNASESEQRLMGVFGRRRELLSEQEQFRNRLNDFDLSETERNFFLNQFRRIQEETERSREAFNTMADGARDAFITYAEQVKNVAEQTKTLVGNIISSLEDNLAEFIQTGRFNFRSFLNDLSRELSRFAARRAIAASLDLFGLGGTGGFGSVFGGGRADGGPVAAGRTYLVGERGPELFRPEMDGTIIPRVQTTNNNNGNIAVSMPVTINGSGLDEASLSRVLRQHQTDTIYQVQRLMTKHNGMLRMA